MRGSINYVTAPQRRVWPKTVWGWVGLAFVLILVLEGASMVLAAALGGPRIGAAPAGTTIPAQVQAQMAIEAEKRAAAERAAKVAAEKAAAEKADAEREAEFVYSLAARSLAVAKASLRDPASARFRDVWAVRAKTEGRTIGVCGVVNSKNAFGAYVGDTPFVARSSVWTPDTPGFAQVFQEMCLDGDKVMEMYR